MERNTNGNNISKKKESSVPKQKRKWKKFKK